jgi:uncharacterized protein
MTTALLEDTTRDQLWAGSVIDCDVHANVPSLETLFAYQDRLWVQWARERGFRGTRGLEVTYPSNAPTTVRREWVVPGRPPASDLSLLREHVLDPWRTERAVLNCYYAIDSLRHPDWAASLASAVNDWMIDQWLEKDPRLTGSIVVPARDPAAAAREIERVAHHPGFVQVLMPVRSDRLYGQRVFHPLWQTVARHDLVLGMHWGGTTDGPPSTSGFPSWYVEEYAAETHMFVGQLMSMIAEGVFRAVPELRVAVLEGGFTWVPLWGWRLNKEWKALRREIPWVDQLPLDLIRRHFRFSTAPVDAGPPEEMAKIIDWLGSEDILMFATDYPHRHDDDLAALLAVMPETMRPKVMAESAREWYRL